MLRAIVLLALVTVQPAILLADDGQAKRKQREEFAKLRMLAEPGEEHAQLKRLVGSWKVSMAAGGMDRGFFGTAKASIILGDRFLVIDGKGKTGYKSSGFRYTIGFDRRHEEYFIVVLDSTGTYHVSGRGKPTEEVIRMFGTDDDPHMKKLGFVKKFAFDLDIKGEDEFSVATLWVDTRTKEEKLIPAFRYVFKRIDAEQ